MLSQKQKDKINLLKSFKGINIKRRNEKGEFVDYFVKPYTVQRIAWMIKLGYDVVSKYLGIDDGSIYKKVVK